VGCAFFGRNDQPPAMAGMMETSSFSEIGVCRFSKIRMSSSIHENVDEAPDLAVGFANAVFHTGELLVDVFN
jgi:hypothetical protein